MIVNMTQRKCLTVMFVVVFVVIVAADVMQAFLS
jgi:hypothetical protein